MTAAVLETNCPDLKLIVRGKVRDIYELENGLLFVASDRLSAFDVILKTGIPGKGKILTQITLFWLEKFKSICDNHLITANIDEMPACVQKYRDQLEGRSMLVRKLTMLPVECIIRGYITGSGWKEYVKSGTVCKIELPKGLKQCEKIEEPLYTPSTKAEDGLHDENIPPEKAAEILGEDQNKKMADLAIQLYNTAQDYASTLDILIADTKFEFGTDENGNLVLADEVLTPDSSRFWPKSEYEIGRDQNSYDKQIVRNYLESINFDKTNPVALPDDVIEKTMLKYLEIFEKLTGKTPDFM